MKLIDYLHNHYISKRRVIQLCKHIQHYLPRTGAILDVGCGDGAITRSLADISPGCRFEGIDVLLRPETNISVKMFDGVSIPYDDNSFDAILLIDVLHHIQNPLRILKEAKRVTRKTIIIKDHVLHGLLAEKMLCFMDDIGNLKYDIVLPYNYFTMDEWQNTFQDVGLDCKVWQESLDLYPWFINWIFGRSLHFVSKLEK
jgi:SAM-dependent methyltransferase